MDCPQCKETMETKAVWDDDQVTDHAHNVYQCEACGLVVHERVWEDKGVTYIYPDGKVRGDVGGLRPIVRDFATAMEAKMSVRDERYGSDAYLRSPLQQLIDHARSELDELQAALGSGGDAGSEAVDTANMAMMAWDWLRQHTYKPPEGEKK